MSKIKHNHSEDNNCNYCGGSPLGVWNGEEWIECPHCENNEGISEENGWIIDDINPGDKDYDDLEEPEEFDDNF